MTEKFDLAQKQKELEQTLSNSYCGFTCGILPGVDTCHGCEFFTDDDRCEHGDKFANHIIKALAPLVEIVDREAELPEVHYIVGDRLSAQDKIHGMGMLIKAGWHKTYKIEGSVT